MSGAWIPSMVDRGAAGAIGGYLSSTGPQPLGGIVVVQEVFGVTDAIREISDDLASAGSMVVAPDLFWRLEPGAQLGNGEDPELRARALELLGRFDVEEGVDDLGAVADHLRTLLPAGRRVAIVGFCIGGRMAALVAAGGHVDAAVSFYGVGLDRYIDRVRSISVPTAFFVGDRDAHIPASTVDLLRETVGEAADRDVGLTVLSDAGHAFYNRHRADSYQPRAAEASREALLGFLSRHVAPREERA